MQKLKLEHFKIIQSDGFKKVELISIKDFIKLTELLKQNIVFVKETNESELINRDFLMIHDGIEYKISGKTFQNIDDYEDASDKGFENPEEYYKAKQGGYVDYKEYIEFKSSGISDRNAFKKAQKLGFTDNYEDFKSKLDKYNKIIPEDFDISNYDNATKLYLYAVNGGFKDFGDFSKAFFFGFSNKITADEAKQMGFTYGREFEEAISLGFENIREFQEARHLKIKNKAEYNQFNFFRSYNKKNYGFDGIQLIEALKQCENCKKISLKKLKEIIETEKEKYKINIDENGNKILPEWYLCKLTSDEQIANFLYENEDIKDYGFYDPDGDYFEISLINTSTIYIDGSNVAFSSMQRTANIRPYYANIIALAKQLKQMRYKNIEVIVDASLCKIVEDVHLIHSLKKEVSYVEAPAKTSADEYLIENVKKNKCFLISNDTFRDWKMKDAWIAENIDDYRIPFVKNTDGSYSLPALEAKNR